MKVIEAGGLIMIIEMMDAVFAGCLSLTSPLVTSPLPSNTVM